MTTPAEQTTPETEADAVPETDAAPPAEAAPIAEVAAPAPMTADFVAGPGGVMTDEVGVVTGDLTLRTEVTDWQVTLSVQYKDADEWYAVTGGRAPLNDPADAQAVHTIVLGILNRPEG